MAVNWALYAAGLRERSLQQKRDRHGRFKRRVKQRPPRQFSTWVEYQALLKIYRERPCKVCERFGFCNHREPRVDLAELAVLREIMERNKSAA